MKLFFLFFTSPRQLHPQIHLLQYWLHFDTSLKSSFPSPHDSSVHHDSSPIYSVSDPLIDSPQPSIDLLNPDIHNSVDTLLVSDTPVVE